MFRFSSLVIVFFLVVITTIYHGFAKTAYQEECENLMVENFIDDKNSDGQSNFKKAFSDLSLRYIESHFEARGVENPIQRQKRILQQNLWTYYFLDLVVDHNINFNSMVSIDEWCGNKATESINNNGAFSTTMINKRHDNKNPSDIFEIFYVEWNTKDLMNNSDNDASTSAEKFVDNHTDRFAMNISRPKSTYSLKPNYSLDFF